MNAPAVRVIAMPDLAQQSPPRHGSAPGPIPAAARPLCPYCRSVETSRSHRRGPIEKYLLRAIHVRVYRCDDCNARFYAFARPDAAMPTNNEAA
jgi:hypothetical protein